MRQPFQRFLSKEQLAQGVVSMAHGECVLVRVGTLFGFASHGKPKEKAIRVFVTFCWPVESEVPLSGLILKGELENQGAIRESYVLSTLHAQKMRSTNGLLVFPATLGPAGTHPVRVTSSPLWARGCFCRFLVRFILKKRGCKKGRACSLQARGVKVAGLDPQR